MIKGSKIFKVTVSGGKVDPKPFNKYDGVLEENHSLKKTGKFLSKRKRS